ncbi:MULTISPECIES: ABC transporter permease [unclassified Streptomyces]|uniref:ABC transporter permease n=1 Tax=unclassified Streptomyces TaxID=2593676 RepID=UPI0006AF4469|nr:MULTISPECIES: ABC transporter permease [unclassified Streptomyces]KOX16186.1 ABC transporter permease [Streptomyces sp. NRRL F-6491]KOX35907.1 ABC transporter permease [Streptomyces sp. NRRL F-6492]
MLVLRGLRARWASLLGGFVALALGVGLVAATGLGLSATFHAPERSPHRFASSPVVVMGHDRLVIDVRRGPGTVPVEQRLDRPQPVDAELLRALRARWAVTAAGGPDAVGVDAPADRVRALVGARARVLTGAERVRADPDPERDARALTSLNALLGTSGGVTAFVSVFVVASTFAFAVALRRREFGLLRTAGATPGQVRRLVLAEAAVLGVLASATGCALGALGAPLLARTLVDGGLAPAWFTIGGASWPYHAAFWTGVTVALAGALAAARRAGRTGPAAALRDADVDADVLPPGRALAGAALLLTGLGLLVWTCATEPSELLKRKTYTTLPMLLIGGTALLAPLLVRPVARLLPLRGAVGTLVRENAAASVRRTAAVAAPVLVTVALAGSLLGSAAGVTRAKGVETREHTAAEYVASGADLRPVTAVPAGAVVSATGATSVFVRDGAEAVVKYGARAVADPAAFAELARLPVVAGDVRDLDDRSIVVHEEFERRRVGETVEVWRADGSGPVRLRVAAVLALGTGDNGPYVTRANAPGAGLDRIEARGGGTATARALEASGGTVATAGAWAAAERPASSPRTRLGLLLVLGAALVHTVIGLVGTLLMATSVRGPELASLRLAGATRAQVLRAVTGEAAFAVAIGALLGLAVTAVVLGALGAGLAALSAPVVPVLPWPAVGTAAGVCAAVAVAASALPAWRLTRA